MKTQDTPYEITFDDCGAKLEATVTRVEFINGHKIETGWRMTDGVRSTAIVFLNGKRQAESYYDIGPHVENAKKWASKQSAKGEL